MKPKLLILLALLGTPIAFAADKHDHSKESKEEHADHDHDHEEGEDDHDHAKKGPNGGHLVTSAAPTFEVSVDKDRKARIVFVDKDNKAVDLGKQTVSGTSGARANPVKLVFTQGKDADANVLISDKPLPEGAHVPMILVIKETPESKAVTARFELHLH